MLNNANGYEINTNLVTATTEFHQPTRHEGRQGHVMGCESNFLLNFHCIYFP